MSAFKGNFGMWFALFVAMASLNCLFSGVHGYGAGCKGGRDCKSDSDSVKQGGSQTSKPSISSSGQDNTNKANSQQAQTNQNGEGTGKATTSNTASM